jgi:hypothetical protein
LSLTDLVASRIAAALALSPGEIVAMFVAPVGGRS